MLMLVDTLILCALLHSMCNLKTAPTNVQHRLIQELMLYQKLGNKAAEAAKTFVVQTYALQETGI